MGIIIWIVIGALAGWLASIVMKRNDSMNWFENIVVGVLGALIGGFLYGLLTDGNFEVGFNILSLLIATGGAIILLAIYGAVRREA